LGTINLFQEFITYYIIQNPVAINPYHKLLSTLFLGGSIFSIIFLGLFVWSFVLFLQVKKLDSASNKFLPRVLGFSFAFVLAFVCFILGGVI
jgi:hypothetical protein